MRHLRLPLLVAMLLISVVVGRSWWHRHKDYKTQDAHPPAPPPANTLTFSQNWHYTQSDKGRNIVEVQARNARQPKDSTLVELEGVELKIFNKDSSKYDNVKSEKALFNTADGILVSDGDVEITLAVPDNGPPKERLLVIRSSGVRFESKTGKATTDKPATFGFDRGDGKSVGASYDPTSHELIMKSQVELHWKGNGKGKEMIVQAGELHYKENESKVYLSPWSKLVRDTLTLNAADSVVTLKEGAIDTVDAQKAQGTDTLPAKKVDYAADQLHMQFSEEGEMKSLEGVNNAKVVSTTATNQTTITADKVNLDFVPSESGSTLQKAVATGKSVVEAKPVMRPGVDASDTRILHSEIVEMTMRPNGQDIDKVTTPTPGTIDFVPNRPTSRKRQMQGEKLDIQYGEDNQVQTFRSVNVSTRTENPPKKGQKTAPPSLTWSKDLLATFDPKTGDMSKLEQWHDFRYEEGERKALAEKAVLEQATDIITLNGKAKVWDNTGSNAADRIIMMQKSDETRAEGNVVSLHMPEQKKEKDKSDTSLLAPDQPMQAKARKMVSTDGNAKIHYEGDAIVWQGVNRLQADVIDIDRDDGGIVANGKVISQFVEKEKEADPKTDSKADPKKKKPEGPPVYTVIRSPHMVYDDETRMAHYTGGVLLTRPGLDVKSAELRAFLKDEQKGDSSLDHAFADGKVEILQRTPERTRTGTGEHSEYYVDEGKIFIKGGEPQLVDSLRGNTARGNQLTYYSNNDRLIVDGETPKKPAITQLKRKPKQAAR